jgi:hypothetical protein
MSSNNNRYGSSLLEKAVLHLEREKRKRKEQAKWPQRKKLYTQTTIKQH